MPPHLHVRTPCVPRSRAPYLLVATPTAYFQSSTSFIPLYSHASRPAVRLFRASDTYTSAPPSTRLQRASSASYTSMPPHYPHNMRSELQHSIALHLQAPRHPSISPELQISRSPQLHVRTPVRPAPPVNKSPPPVVPSIQV